MVHGINTVCHNCGDRDDVVLSPHCSWVGYVSVGKLKTVTVRYFCCDECLHEWLGKPREERLTTCTSCGRAFKGDSVSKVCITCNQPECTNCYDCYCGVCQSCDVAALKEELDAHDRELGKG